MSIILINDSLLFGEALQLILSAHDFDVELLNIDIHKIRDINKVDTEATLILIIKKLQYTIKSSIISDCKTFWPNAKIAFVSETFSSDDIKLLLKSGASGCISERKGVNSLLAAINLIHAGEKFMPISSFLTENLEEKFTKRELSVAINLIAGNSNKEIAKILNLVEATVKLHVKMLMRKLKAKNRVHAVSIILTNNLLTQSQLQATLNELIKHQQENISTCHIMVDNEIAG